jgi:hypothetical protein
MKKTMTKTHQAKKAGSWILKNSTLFTITVKWAKLSTKKKQLSTTNYMRQPNN